MKVFARALLPLLLLAGACVTVDSRTGEVQPRGKQRYKFDYVTDRADRLSEGMSKVEVLLLLGSPAEKDEAGNVWVWLPERPAVLIPGRALRVEFHKDRVIEHGYRPILLGENF